MIFYSVQFLSRSGACQVKKEVDPLPRRVVVTGMGIVCAIGNNCPEVWNNVLAGKSGIGKISLFDAGKFPCKIAGEVKNFDPLDFVEKKDLKKMARFICLAIAAADEAIKMAGLA